MQFYNPVPLPLDASTASRQTVEFQTTQTLIVGAYDTPSTDPLSIIVYAIVPLQLPLAQVNTRYLTTASVGVGLVSYSQPSTATQTIWRFVLSSATRL